VLGGTFNPPHRGHLELARAARDQLFLHELMLVPARVPPHKGDEPDPGPEHRLQMCRLAVEHEPRLTVSQLELERDGPSYTVDTLTAIHDSRPDAQLTFILGADIAGTLSSWHEPGRLLALADLAVASRSGSARAGVLDAVRTLGRGADAVTFLDMAPVGISSSEVRERVREHQPIDRLVEPAVAGYIAHHGLYTEPSRDGELF
jgi:nicotinate-nucleotide adenylyltransferase